MAETNSMPAVSDPLPGMSDWTVLTTAEVASLLKVSAPKVRLLVEDGLLETLAGMRTYRFTASALRAYLMRKR